MSRNSQKIAAALKMNKLCAERNRMHTVKCEPSPFDFVKVNLYFS